MALQLMSPGESSKERHFPCQLTTNRTTKVKDMQLSSFEENQKSDKTKTRPITMTTNTHLQERESARDLVTQMNWFGFASDWLSTWYWFLDMRQSWNVEKQNQRNSGLPTRLN